jgi:hypothetical protein
MGQSVPAELFPPDFPAQLAEAAFIWRTETAWRPDVAATAVEWFGAHGYAVLGTELWLVQGGRIQSLPIGLSGQREAHGNTVNREEDEPWDAFVVRSTGETSTYLREFSPSDITEAGELHFQVSWISEIDFKNLRVC